MTNLCVRCGRPTPDGYCCSGCASELADALLVAAGHAEDAEAVIARQARYGGGGRGSGGEPLPDLTRSARFDAVKLAADGWVSVLLADEPFPPWQRTIGPLCPPLKTAVTLDDGEVMFVRCPHTSCAAIRVTVPPSTLAREFSWLSGHVSALRVHPAAGEAFKKLHDACDQLARLVDRPADKEIVGMCDCGKVLYAAHGRSYVQCPVPTCKRDWHVERSRDILRKALDGKLVTVSEAARLAAYLDSRRTQEAIRKLLGSRIGSGQLAAHGVLGAESAYRFGEVVAVLASIQIRQRRAAA